MHDCALQDMKSLENELVKVGSFYLHKSEVLIDPSNRDANSGERPLPCRDRLELLNDLLTKEAEF